MVGDMVGEVRISEAPWLAGPVGKGRIDSGFPEEYAREAGLEIIRDDPVAWLLPDFGALAGERTARYGLEVWSEWSRVLRYPPRTLIYLVSRNI
jgi:hypothetical protein